MPEKKVILVTGVSKPWGEQMAAQLVAQPGFHVVGLDSEKPKLEIKGLDFIQADIRNPLLVDLLKAEQVDTLCHLAIMETRHPSEAAFENNVMGTIKVFGACALAGVRKIVLKSTTMVYGARPDNSFYLNEEGPLRGSQTHGYTRDMIEIEAFCNGFRRQAPEVQLTILRFAHIIGPEADTPMTRFLKEPWTPVLWGFNPIMQVIHESDVVGALVHSVVQDTPGVFNVAAEDHMPLERLMALAGKFPLPIFHLFVYWGAGLMGGVGLPVARVLPIEPDYLRYGHVGDLNRMRTELCFSPRYTAEGALREFAGHQRVSPYRREAADLEHDEELLKDTIERRRRATHRKAAFPVDGDEQEDATGQDDPAGEEGAYHE